MSTLKGSAAWLSDELAPPVVTGRAKVGEKLGMWAADLLQQELMDARLQPGDLLGSMGEIRRRYGLGRWACREAIRILEMRGVASARTGPRGGLIVAAPRIGHLANLMLLHLSLGGALTDQIDQARRGVHRAMLRKLMLRGPGTSPRTGPEDDGCCADDWAFARRLARETGNPGFRFLVDLLEALYAECSEGLGAEASPRRPFPDGPPPGFWPAVTAGAAEAEALLEAYLGASERLPPGQGVGLPGLRHEDGALGASKASRRLALRLIDEMLSAGLCGTINLGSEFDIASRHDCNGEIVRQAVRVLEDLGVVSPRIGCQGGLLTRTPDIAAAIRLIPHVLRQYNPQPAQCFEAIFLLKVEMHRLAAERAKREGEGGPTCCAADRWAQAPFRGIENLIACERGLSDLSGNRILTSAEFGFVLYTPAPLDARRLEGAQRAHVHAVRIAKAIRRGDPAGAVAAALEKFDRFSSDLAEWDAAGAACSARRPPDPAAIAAASCGERHC